MPDYRKIQDADILQLRDALGRLAQAREAWLRDEASPTADDRYIEAVGSVLREFEVVE